MHFLLRDSTMHSLFIDKFTKNRLSSSWIHYEFTIEFTKWLFFVRRLWIHLIREFNPRENKMLICRISTVVVTEQLFWLSVMRNWPVLDQTQLTWQNWIIYYTNSESSLWGGSNDVYIVWLLMKINETTSYGQLWPLILTESGQNNIDGWRTIQIWNPLVEAVRMMYNNRVFIC